MMKRYLSENARRHPLYGTQIVADAVAGLKAGAVVFVKTDDPDDDGEILIYVDDRRLAPSGYVDAAIVVEVDPSAPMPKAEVVEEIVTTTKKTVVLRLTEEEAETLSGLIGWHVGGGEHRRRLNEVYSALRTAGLDAPARIGSVTVSL